MLVFIDDSGDAGFKLNKGSSDYFVIVAIIFYDDLEAEKTAIAIKELKREFGFPAYVEFKFNKSRKVIRIKFLKVVNKFNFKIRCLVVNKKNIYSYELRNNKDSFYRYMIKTMLFYSDESIINARIKIDGSGDRLFRKNFMTYLRKYLNSPERRVLKNCRLVDSKNDVLIQMADMIAGSIRRFYDIKKNDHKIYIKIITKHIIEDNWKFK